MSQTLWKTCDLHTLMAATKKVEPSGSVFPIQWQRFKQTKHHNRFSKTRKSKACGHRLFTLTVPDTPALSWPNTQGAAIGNHGYMGGLSSGKSAYAANIYKQSQSRAGRGVGKTIILDLEMLDFSSHFRMSRHIDAVREQVEHVHSQVCGCKQFAFVNQKINWKHSAHRITCKNMDLLEFQLAFEDGLDEVFNGKRTNTGL